MKKSIALLSTLAAAALGGAPAYAVSVDLWNDITNSSFTDGTATVSFSPVVGKTSSDRGLKATYDMTGGGYLGGTLTLSARNLARDNATHFRFKYRATGAVNTIQIMLFDNDSSEPSLCDKLVYKPLLVADNQWRELTVPFVDFSLFNTGNGSFSMANVTRLGMGLTGDSGNTTAGSEIYFDDIVVISSSSLIDGFETDDVNDRGRLAGFFQGGGAAGGSRSYVNDPAVSGSVRSVQVVYNTGAGYAGFYEVLGGMTSPNPSEDKITFWAKGSAGGEPLRIQLKESSTDFTTRALSGWGTLTTSFQKFSIPISTFSDVNPRAMQELVFLIETTHTGTFYIDNVALEGSGASLPVGVVDVLEDFSQDKPTLGYGEYASSNAGMSWDFVRDETVPGAKAGNMVGRLRYSFSSLTSPVPYAVAERDLRPPLYAEPAVNLRFLGTGGNNKLEVKLIDTDSTTFIKRFPRISNTSGEWKELSIPVEEFSLSAAGSDSSLDLKKLNKVELVLVKGESGTGTFTLDRLSFGGGKGFGKEIGGSVLRSVSTPANPFSPNGDGVGDAGLFVCTLAAPAHVTLRIHSVRGEILREIDAGTLPAGESTVVWDGTDRDGRRVSNGIYFFSLEADGGDEGKDTFKQMIGVVR